MKVGMNNHVSSDGARKKSLTIFLQTNYISAES